MSRIVTDIIVCPRDFGRGVQRTVRRAPCVPNAQGKGSGCVPDLSDPERTRCTSNALPLEDALGPALTHGRGTVIAQSHRYGATPRDAQRRLLTSSENATRHTSQTPPTHS